MSISAIYGPNTDCPEFFEELFREVFNLNQEYNIFCGDFNTAPENRDYFDYADSYEYCDYYAPYVKPCVYNTVSS